MSAPPRTASIAAATIAALLLLGARSSYACTVCIPFPERSLADHIIESDAVVLARENPQAPFSYSVTEVLAGEALSSEPDLFLDSSTRRSLANRPDRYSVLSHRAADGSWRRLIAVGDSEAVSVVRQILDRAAGWQVLESDNMERLTYFAAMLGHPDRTLHELAYLEVGRAPYRAIRDLSARVSVEDIRAFLDNLRYIEWHALYILMLAQHATPADAERIRDRAHAAARYGLSLNLSAWLTAYVEIDGAVAVEFIESEMFGNWNAVPATLNEALKALSVHGNEGRPALRDRIVASYGTLLATHPSMGTSIVNDLVSWQRTEHVDSLSRVRNSLADRDPLGAYAIERYLQLFRHRG